MKHTNIWRAARLLVLCGAVLILTGFLTGPPRHSVSPTALCNAGCSAAENDAALRDARNKLQVAEASMALSLGISNWNALEVCKPAGAPLPPGATNVVQRSCYFDQAGVGFESPPRACSCFYDFTALDDYLGRFAGDPGTTDGLGLDVLIQLAPIFTLERAIPPYLWTTRYDDSSMITAFDGLWSALSDRLAQYPGRTFLVSIGNEVNFYLTFPNPNAPAAAAPNLERTADDAWASYTSFYKVAADHVRTQGNANVQRVVGVTLTWGSCGGGANVQQQADESVPGCGAGCPTCTVLTGVSLNQRATSLLGPADIAVFTSYYTLGSLPAPNTVATVMESEMSRMASLGAVTLNQKPVALQELGHGSSALNPTDRALETPQRDFVGAIYDRVPLTNAQFASTTGGFEPIRGFNIFHTQDFSTPVIDEFNECTGPQDCLAGTTCQTAANPDGSWVQLNTTTVPPKRQDSDMAFDSLRNQVVLFGGVQVPPNQPTPNGQTDAWFLPVPIRRGFGATRSWQAVTTTGGPPSGNGSQAVYETARDRVIVITSNQTAPNPLEFWSLARDASGANGTWTQLSPDTTGVDASFLVQHQFGRAAYDPPGDRVLLFGGRIPGPTPGGVSSGDLVVLDLSGGGDGVVSALTTSVPAREEFGFVFDAAENRAIIYGGAGPGANADVWELDFDSSPLGVATELAQTNDPTFGTPLPRVLFTGVNDEARHRALLFGGAIPLGPAVAALANDVWQLDYGTPGQATWKRLSPDAIAGPPSPRARFGASGTFAPTIGRMVVFGGVIDFFDTALDDTWELESDFLRKCILANPNCGADTDCDTITTSAGLGAGFLKCCKKADLCGAALGTCVLASACDFATLIAPAVTSTGNPTGACPGGQDSECPTSAMCDTTHRCVDPAIRAGVCSWGLIDGAGLPKPAWNEFLSRSVAFTP